MIGYWDETFFLFFGFAICYVWNYRRDCTEAVADWLIGDGRCVWMSDIVRIVRGYVLPT